MNNKLLKKSVYLNALIGLGVIGFIIYDLTIRGINIRGIQLHVFFDIVQLIAFGLTLLLYSNHFDSTREDCESITVEYKELTKFNKLIIDITPTGLVVLNKIGIIEYVNQSTGNILGSTKTVGLNILEFDTIRQSKLYNGIYNASTGIYTEILGEHYTSFTSRDEKVLNIYISPVIDDNNGNVTNIILFIHDITKEHELKVDIEKTYLSTIKAFAELVDARDKYTGKHSENVTKYVSMICVELNIDEKMKTQIQIAAKIHDMGKIGISDKLLNKPGRLTNEEYDCIKKHSALGAEITNKISGFDDISLMIRHHHEKWDGRGYPSGLKDSEIPLGSQIIAIADAYDAITTDRVYRKKLGKEVAIKILLEEKGKQFNPELVDIFIKKILLA